MQKKGGISLTTEQIIWIVLFLLAFTMIYILLKSRIFGRLFGGI